MRSELAAELHAVIDKLALEAADGPECTLGDLMIDINRAGDRLQSVFATSLRRFDKAREFVADDSLSSVAWMRWRCNITGASAARRLGVARRLPELPETATAFAAGDITYQHVALITETADQVGAEPVQQLESTLVTAAKQLGPGRFRYVTDHLRHAAAPELALKDANEIHERRFLNLSQSLGGIFYLDGRVDAEGGAVLKTLLEAMSAPEPGDERSGGQRRMDALVGLARRELDRGRLPEVAGERPHLTVTATLATLAGLAGQPAGELEWSLPVPSETVRRLACDCIATMVVCDRSGNPLYVGRETRVVSPRMKKALAFRDGHCRFPGCDRPLAWTEAHHLKHWIDGGPTDLSNLASLCAAHHRKVHEEGWRLAWGEEGEIVAIPARHYRPRLRSPAGLALADLPAG
jgi:hypothetical protein